MSYARDRVSAPRTGFRVVRYEGQRKFGNGIGWLGIEVRFRNRRFGLRPALWWRDTRIAGASEADTPNRKLPVGPYRVALLWRWHG